jgi:hypothetical protein
MNTRKIASEYRLSHWSGVLQERNASGLSIKEFCETAGLHENEYYYWQRKLREAACEQRGIPGFTEIRLAEGPREISSKETVESGQLCVEANGIHITADSSYPADKLAVLLRELGKQC